MRQLQRLQQIAVGAELMAVGSSGQFEQGSQVADSLLIDHQLPCIGSTLGHNCCRLEPDQLRSATGKSLISPPHERVRPTVYRTVAPFHRMNADGVSNRK